MDAQFIETHYPDMPTDLQKRVAARMEAIGIKAAPLARKAGLGESFVRDILRGKTSVPKADNLALLAAALDTTPDYLLGKDAPEDASTLGPAQDRSGIKPPFAGYVRAGLFETFDPYFQQDHVEVPEFVQIQPGYGRIRQYAYQAKGDSMDEAGIREGMWIVAADAADMIDMNGDLESGDLVIVERTEAQRSSRELTVKEIRYYRDRYELLPRSSNAEHKPIIVKHNHDADADGIEVKIVGVVLTAYTDFRRNRR